MMLSPSEVISKYRPDLSEYEVIYKDLHQNPGLSLQETYAAASAAGYLRSIGDFEIKTNIGGHGLVGILKNGPGKTVLLRADIDALPVKELTGLPYASEVTSVDVADGVSKSVMHACGHDMHIACMLAAARTLHAARKEWTGTLIILFQPNEERGAGAQAMIDDGLYDPQKHACPVPDIVLGQHVMPNAAGEIGTRRGPCASSADSFEITLHGRGGHASQPHRTIDPVVMAAQVIVRLQTIVSREVDPKDSAVVTVGSLHSGMTENIIADSAVLKVNVRAVKPDTRTRVLASIRRIVIAECEASGAPRQPEFVPTSSFPFTINDDYVTAELEGTFKAHFGDAYSSTAPPLGGSEDFSILATEAPHKDGKGKGVPYCYWVFGGTDPKKFTGAAGQSEGSLPEDIPINHSAYFAPVIHPTLGTGADGLVVAALTFLH